MFPDIETQKKKGLVDIDFETLVQKFCEKDISIIDDPRYQKPPKQPEPKINERKLKTS
jgi:hypothetical protein